MAGGRGQTEEGWKGSGGCGREGRGGREGGWWGGPRPGAGGGGPRRSVNPLQQIKWPLPNKAPPPRGGRQFRQPNNVPPLFQGKNTVKKGRKNYQPHNVPPPGGQFCDLIMEQGFIIWGVYVGFPSADPSNLHSLFSRFFRKFSNFFAFAKITPGRPI